MRQSLAYQDVQIWPLVTIMNLPMKMMEVAGMWVLVMTIVIAI